METTQPKPTARGTESQPPQSPAPAIASSVNATLAAKGVTATVAPAHIVCAPSESALFPGIKNSFPHSDTRSGVVRPHTMTATVLYRLRYAMAVAAGRDGLGNALYGLHFQHRTGVWVTHSVGYIYGTPSGDEQLPRSVAHLNARSMPPPPGPKANTIKLPSMPSIKDLTRDLIIQGGIRDPEFYLEYFPGATVDQCLELQQMNDSGLIARVKELCKDEPHLAAYGFQKPGGTWERTGIYI